MAASQADLLKTKRLIQAGRYGGGGETASPILRSMRLDVTKHALQRELLVSKPTSLGDAFSLARVTEARLDDQLTFTTSSGLVSSSGVETLKMTPPHLTMSRPEYPKTPLILTAPKPPLAIKWISPIEHQEWLSKGLCFNCDNRWVRRHKCPGKFMLLMTNEEEDLEPTTKASQEDALECGDISILNSLVGHALELHKKRVLSLPNTAYPSLPIRRIQLDNYSEIRSTDTPYPTVGYDVSTFLLRTTISTKELITPFENPEKVFLSKRRLFETPGLVESSSPKLDLFFDIKEHLEEETIEIMTEPMEQYMSKTCGNYGSGVVRPKINDKTHFELKGQYLKELCENTFSGSEHEDANEHIKNVLEIIDLFHILEVTQDQEVILFYNGLDVPTRQILDSKGAIPTKTAADAKIAIQEMLNNLGREINKVNKKVYAAQVGCELCKGPHYTKDCPLKEEGNTLEEAYYTQFGAPYQPG
ncbi:nucleobase-ascorbate transporter 12 [Tanacetum coccineum]